MTLKPRMIFIALLAAATTALSACGGGTSESGEDPLNILFVGGLTGVYSPTAKAIERGARAHVEYINDNGGINGREIEFTVEDNQSDPTRGATLIQDALSGDDKPDLVIPGASSNEAMAAAPMLARNEVVGITSSSSPVLDDVEKFPYTFSNSVTTESIIEGSVDYIVDQGDIQNVVLVAPNDALGDATAESFETAFAGTDVATTVVSFPAEGLDYAPSLQKAVASKPDWMIMEGTGEQVASLLSARVKATGENIPTLLGISASTQPLLDFASGQELKNIQATMNPLQAFIPEDERGEQFTAFFERVHDQGELEVTLATYGAGWDYIGLWANAVRSLDGEVTGKAIREALETLPREDDPQFPLYSGDYTKESHFHPGTVEDFTFGTPKEAKDGMIVLEEG